MKGLGSTQKDMIRSLEQHKLWHKNCGWVCGSGANTIRLLESLVRRGIVVKTEEKIGSISGHITRDVYRLREGRRS